MKNLLSLLIVTLITFTLHAQNTNSTAIAMHENSNAGIIKFKSEVIDYGTIQQNSDGNRVFEFKNTGNAPIIISRVKASCGCTVATKPNQPIMPGETAEIGVKYATNRIGTFSKSITIFSNAKVGTKVVKIKGTILKSENSLEKQKSIVSSN